MEWVGEVFDRQVKKLSPSSWSSHPASKSSRPSCSTGTRNGALIMVRRLSPSKISGPSFRRPSMSPTPALRVVAGGVASSFRNRSAIERCRYRSHSCGRDGTFFCGSAAIFRAMLYHERENSNSVKALPPVGGARSATQQKGARWGIASSLSATGSTPGSVYRAAQSYRRAGGSRCSSQSTIAKTRLLQNRLLHRLAWSWNYLRPFSSHGMPEAGTGSL